MAKLTSESAREYQKLAAAARKKNFQPCNICTAADRPAIEKKFLYKGNKRKKEEINFMKIARWLHKKQYYAERYETIMALYSVILRHYEHMEKAPQYVIIEVDRESKGKSNVDIESFAQSLLEIANDGLEFYKKNPWKMDPKIALEAQKVLISKKNSRTKEHAIKLGMARMFGGFGDIEEGEVVDGIESGLEEE